MKIFLLSRDIDLKNELDSTGYFAEVSINERIDSISEDCDIILISDSILEYNDFVSAYDKLKILSGRRIYYMMSNNYSKEVIENMTWLLKSKKIHVIPPKLTLSQIKEVILEDILPGFKREKNSITFFGADSKVGTTMIAQSVAEALSKNTNAKIGFLSLSGYPGTEYTRNTKELGLDNLKVKLLNNILTKDELILNCIENDNLYILPGISSILDIRQYHPEHIEKLINLASQCFNVVIVDAGSCRGLDLCAGMSIAALNASKHTYFLTTQQKAAYDIFYRTKSQIFDILQIKPESFYLLVNKYLKTEGISQADELARQYNMTLAGYVPGLDYKGWESEFENSTLFGTDAEFDYYVEQIAKLIASQLEIRYVEKAVKRSFLNKLFKVRR